MAAQSGDRLLNLALGASVAALGYGIYSSFSRGEGASEGPSLAPPRAPTITTAPPEPTSTEDSTYLRYCMPALCTATQDILPMLLRIDAEKTKGLMIHLESFAECGARVFAEMPPKPLVDAQSLKCKIVQTLQELKKQGKRTLRFETLEASEDFSNIVGHINDALHNMHQESSLKMQGA